MLENMVYHRGLGLSANQIGMPVKVFATRVDDSDNAIVCFNPKITKESDETVMMKEGCLSYIQLYLNVKRPQAIEGTYQNADGDEINVHFEGLAARIFHHEMDHMEGNTFLNRVSRVFLPARRKQKKLLRKADKMEEQVEKFGSGRKQKRLNNKRQRGQVRNYLKGNRPEDFIEDIDDDYYEEEEWQMAS